MDAYFNDCNSGNDLTVRLYSYQGPNSALIATVSSSGNSCTPGGLATTTASHDVSNANGKEYFVGVTFPVTESTLSLQSVVIRYRLAVSPAPATATFSDVPTTHLFFQYIEALAAAGITSGCGGGNYCPDSPVTRGQIAVFLSKALGLHWSP